MALQTLVVDFNDQAHERADNTDFVSGGQLILSHVDTPGLRYQAGFRHPGVGLPQGTNVVSATLRLSVQTAGGIYAALKCDDQDDSDSFAGTPDVVGRARTLASDSADDASVGTGYADFGGVSLGLAVKEVLARAGWVSGNAITVLVDPSLGVDRWIEAIGVNLTIQYDDGLFEPGLAAAPGFASPMRRPRTAPRRRTPPDVSWLFAAGGGGAEPFPFAAIACHAPRRAPVNHRRPTRPGLDWLWSIPGSAALFAPRVDTRLRAARRHRRRFTTPTWLPADPCSEPVMAAGTFVRAGPAAATLGHAATDAPGEATFVRSGPAAAEFFRTRC